MKMRKLERYPVLMPPNVGHMAPPSTRESGELGISSLPRTISDQDLSGSEGSCCWAVVLLRFEDLVTNFGFLENDDREKPMVPSELKDKG